MDDRGYGRTSTIVMRITHGVTGILFLVLNAILYYALIPGHMVFAVIYDPFFAFCCWGWYAEARSLWTGRAIGG